LQVRRREFIAGLGGAAAWPLASRAQQRPMPTIGYLDTGSPEAGGDILAAFRKGLSETGFVEGKEVRIEYRWGYNDPTRVPELVSDLVGRRVSVIVSVGSPAATRALKAATTTIPIVFRTAADPVQVGIVASLDRPGGNVTGVTSMSGELGPKRLGLLHELMPRAERFGALISPTFAVASVTADLQAAAAAIGRPLEILPVGTDREIDTAFASLARQRVDAVLLGNHILFNIRRVQVVTLAAYHHLPAIYYTRLFVDIGGLISYGASGTFSFSQAGLYTGRILNGEKASDLPVLQPTKFELIINLQTARTLGLEIPPMLLALLAAVLIGVWTAEG
jgi:putative tryptophan/tyrosine transport system substrate-binding protein